MVVLVSENPNTQRVSIRDPNAIVVQEKAVGGNPSRVGRGVEVGGSDRVGRESGSDICMKLLNIHQLGCPKDGFAKIRSTQRCVELRLSEHRSEIMRIGKGVATIPLFRVDVPSSS